MKIRDDEGGCCVDCHFRWEDRVMLPVLDRVCPHVAREIRSEHDRLRALEQAQGAPPIAALAAHAHWEDLVLRQFLPRQVYLELRRQHDELEHRLLTGTTK